jgi:hypothetical protein
MKTFVTETEKRLKEYFRTSEDETLRTIVAADALPTGKVALALILPGESDPPGTEPKMLFITQWGQKKNAVKDAIEKMVQNAIEEGATRSRDSYRGTDITTIKSAVEPDAETESGDSSPSGDNNAQARELFDELSYCFVDDALIVSEAVNPIEFVIAHINGTGTETLAESDSYISAIKAVGPYNDIEVFVNTKELISGFVAEDSSGNLKPLFAGLGLDSIDGYAFSLGIARESGFNYVGKMAIKTHGEKRGVTKMLDFVLAPCKGPKYASPKVCSATFINLDLGKAYDELFKVLAQFQPMFAASLNSPITPPTEDGKAGLTLKEGFLNHLGSEIIITESFEESDNDDESIDTEMLLSISVKNREKLENALSQVHAMMIGVDSDAKREFLGHTIYLVKIPGLTSPPPGQMTLSDENEIKGGLVFNEGGMPAFTVTDTALLVGGESSIEQALRMLSDSNVDALNSAKWYRQARSLVPQMVGVGAFSDGAAQAEQFWKAFKKTFGQQKKTDGSISTGMFMFDVSGPEIERFRKTIDSSMLPEFEKVRKYFGVGAFYGVSRPDGFYFEFRNVNPTVSSSGR